MSPRALEAPSGSGATGATPRGSGITLAVLATALFASAAVLVRSARDVPPAGLAAGRLLVGAAFVGLLGFITRTPMTVRRKALFPLAGIGAIAAAHFLAYILALSRTSIAHTLVLVNLSPVFVALLSPFWLRERLGPRKIPGIIAALIGLAVMVGFEPRITLASLTGDILALGSGLAYALYSLAGRSERDRHPLFRYAFWVYLLAGLILLPFGRPGALGASLRGANLIALILLGLLPTGLGHTLYNASLRRTSAALANLIATQEVTGGVILGYLFFHEGLSATALAGGLLALLGVILVVSTERVSIVRQTGGKTEQSANTP